MHTSLKWNIRQANNRDCNAVRVMIFHVLDEYGLKPDPDSTDRDLYDFESFYFSNNGDFFVVEQGNNIVASVGILRHNESTCELRKMYLQKDTRGKGLGTHLLKLAVNRAKELGYTRMVLETATPLVEAIALYKKFGFTQYEPESIACRCDQAFEYYL